MSRLCLFIIVTWDSAERIIMPKHVLSRRSVELAVALPNYTVTRRVNNEGFFFLFFFTFFATLAH